jgi:diguanylate cyclase (GGDEF)-like protein
MGLTRDDILAVLYGEETTEAISPVKKKGVSSAPVQPTEEEVDALIDKYSEAYGVDSNFAKAIASQESRKRVLRNESSGASGIMQMMPATEQSIAESLGESWEPEDWLDPETNVRRGVRLIADLYNKYQRYDFVAGAYKTGEGAIDSAIKKAQAEGKEPSIPYTYDKHVDEYTPDYVNKIMTRMGANPIEYASSVSPSNMNYEDKLRKSIFDTLFGRDEAAEETKPEAAEVSPEVEAISPKRAGLDYDVPGAGRLPGRSAIEETMPAQQEAVRQGASALLEDVPSDGTVKPGIFTPVKGFFVALPRMVGDVVEGMFASAGQQGQQQADFIKKVTGVDLLKGVDTERRKGDQVDQITSAIRNLSPEKWQKEVDVALAGPMWSWNPREIDDVVNKWATSTTTNLPQLLTHATGPAGSLYLLEKRELGNFASAALEIGIPSKISEKYGSMYSLPAGASEYVDNWMMLGAGKVPGINATLTGMKEKALSALAKKVGTTTANIMAKTGGYATIGAVEGSQELGQNALQSYMLGLAAKEAGFDVNELRRQGKIPKLVDWKSFAEGAGVGILTRGMGDVVGSVDVAEAKRLVTQATKDIATKPAFKPALARSATIEAKKPTDAAPEVPNIEDIQGEMTPEELDELRNQIGEMTKPQQPDIIATLLGEEQKPKAFDVADKAAVARLKSVLVQQRGLTPDEAQTEAEAFYGGLDEKQKAHQLALSLDADTDPLTGLLNRQGAANRGYLDIEKNEWLPREDGETDMVMFDIDEFKWGVNEPHGHRTGDAVLDAFGGMLKERLGDRADIVRYGGEEIAALPKAGVDRDQFLKDVDAVRKELAGMEFADGKLKGVTFSAGYGKTFDDADKQLGLAKKGTKAVTYKEGSAYADTGLQPTERIEPKRRSPETVRQVEGEAEGPEGKPVEEVTAEMFVKAKDRTDLQKRLQSFFRLSEERMEELDDGSVEYADDEERFWHGAANDFQADIETASQDEDTDEVKGLLDKVKKQYASFKSGEKPDVPAGETDEVLSDMQAEQKRAADTEAELPAKGYTVAKNQPKSQKQENYLYKLGFRPYMKSKDTGELTENALGIWAKPPKVKPAKATEKPVEAKKPEAPAEVQPPAEAPAAPEETPEEVAKRYGGIHPESIRKLDEFVEKAKAGDADALRNLQDALHPDNRNLRKYFADKHGQELPKGVNPTNAIIDEWVKGFKPAASKEAAKEPWEMTIEEYRKSFGHDPNEKHVAADASHAVSVADAAALGKPVPENVLNQYPDIKEEFKKKDAPETPKEKLTYDDFSKQYRDAFSQSMKYTPDQIGSKTFTDKMAALADEYPDFLERLESEEEQIAQAEKEIAENKRKQDIATGGTGLTPEQARDAYLTGKKVRWAPWSGLEDKGAMQIQHMNADGAIKPVGYGNLHFNPGNFILDAEQKAAPATEESGVKPGTGQLVRDIHDAISRGESFDNPKLTAMAEKAYGGSIAQGKYTSRDKYDALEEAVVTYIRGNKTILEGDDATVLKNLRALLKRLPGQTDRTEEQIEFQQFSTPPTHSFIAAKALAPTPDDVILEPSAGTGSLAVMAEAVSGGKPKIYTNEISERRQGHLKRLGFDVTNVDASLIDGLLPAEIKPTAIIMNPPFSATGGRVKGHNTMYGARHVEQALSRLEPSGRLVAIVGQGMALDRPTFKNWWKGLAAKYNVRANIGIPGEEYGKYGTTFGNQLLIIDNNGPTPGANYAEQLKNIIKMKAENLEGVLNAIKNIAQDRPALAKPEVSAGVVVGKQGERTGGGAGTAQQRSGGAGLPGGDVGPEEDGGPVSGNVPGTKPVGDTGGGAGQPEPKPAEQPKPESAVVVSAKFDEATDGGIESVIGSEKDTEKREEEAGGKHVKYRPSKLKAGKPHPAHIVESASMASVEPPDITYTPNLPKSTIEDGKISNVQLETIVYAGQSFEKRLPDGKRAGYYIGDGTGLGKGRELAGIIFDQWRRGVKKAIWVSVSTDLKEAAKGDFQDIGAGDIPLTLINDFQEKETIAQPEGVIFMTYSTFSRPKRLQQIKDWLGDDCVIIFDESHRAKNVLASGSMGKPTQTGEAVVNIQGSLKNARVVYSSATGATDVRNMAYMTRLGLWGEGTSFPGGFQEFLNEVAGGGVGSMEMVARDMKALGMYSSRFISYDGVEYTEAVHKVTQEQKQMYDFAAEAWQTILINIDKALGITHAGARQKAMKMAAFWGTHQRFFKQVITAMKVPSLLKHVERSLDSGKSVVISLKGTAEARSKAMVEQAHAEHIDLDDLDFTPKAALIDLIDKAFPVEEWQDVTDETGSTITVQVKDKDGNPVLNKEALKLREALKDKIMSISLPENPLDMIVNHFGEDKVAEMTGRKRRLIKNKKTGKQEYKKRSGADVAMNKVNLHERNLFQSGKKRIAIISDAASTGISLHASMREKNQQRREQIALEVGWSADKEIQTLGRSHRSDQASPPVFTLFSSDIGGEKRFVSTLARRLESLGALTKGQRDVSGAGEMAKYNFNSEYGEAGLTDLYEKIMRGGDIPGVENPKQALRDMGVLVVSKDGERIKDDDKANVDKFLNRVLALQVDRQNAMFDAFTQKFEEAVGYAKSTGAFDEGVSDIKAKKIEMKGKPVIINTDPLTGAQTKHYEVDITNDTSPLDWSGAQDKAKTTPKELAAAGFWKNNTSGNIFAVQRLADITDAWTGRVVDNYRLWRPSNVADALDGDKLRERYEKVSDADAEKWWKDTVSKMPKTRTHTDHIIAGAILPLWQKIKPYAQNAKIVRVSAGNERIVGLLVPRKSVAAILRAVGIQQSFAGPAEIYAAVWDGDADVDLVGGMVIKKARFHGDDAIEVVGHDYFKYDELRRMGLIEEVDQYKKRFFIPSNMDDAIPIIKKLTDRYPAIDKEVSEDEDTETNALRAKVWDVEMSLEAQTKERQNKTKIMDMIGELFGVAVKGKATHRWKHAGMYYNEKSLIRMKTWGEIEVACHEVAHHIDYLLRKQLGRLWKSHGTKGYRGVTEDLKALDYDVVAGVRPKDKGRLNEGFAEYMRYWLTTDKADSKAPKFDKFFTEEFLQENPDLKDKLSKMRGVIKTWYEQGAEARMEAQVDWRKEHVKPGAKGMLVNAWDWIQDKWIDSLHTFDIVEQQAGLKGKLRPSRDPKQMAVYAKSKAAAITRTMVKDKMIDPYGRVLGPGLGEILSPLKGKKQFRQFVIYAAAKRAQFLNRKGIESGFDSNDVEYILNKYQNPQWDEMVEQVREWSNGLLSWLKWAGTMTDEDFAKVKKANLVYLPFMRAFKEELQVVRGGLGGGIDSGKGIHRIKGSGRPIINPVESMIQQATAIIQKAHKSRVAMEVANLANEKELGGLITEVPPPMGSAKVDVEQVITKMRELGFDVEQTTMEGFITFFTQQGEYHGKDNIVSIYKDGQRKFYEINTQVWNAIKSMDAVHLPPVLRFVSGFAKVVRSGATGLRVAFNLVKNPFRDALTYAALSKSKSANPFEPFLKVPEAINPKEGSIFWRYRASGGDMAGMMGFDRQTTMRIYDEMLLDNLGKKGIALKIVKHPINAFREFISFFELAPRMAELESRYNEYKRINPQWTEEDAYIAAFNDAQDVTVNFTRSGDYGKIINEMSAFFNVAIQGPNKVFRAAKENPALFALKGLAYITTPALMMYFWNRDKDWFKNLPFEYKYSNLFIHIPGTKEVIRLPIPFDIGVIFASLPQALMDMDAEAAKAIGNIALKMIPDAMPNIISPIVDMWRNKDFLGRPIQPDYLKYAPMEERKTEWTPEYSAVLSQGLNALGVELSPIQVNYMLDAYTGGFIRQLPLHAIRTAADIPVLGEVLLRTPEKPRRQLDYFFRRYEVLDNKNRYGKLVGGEFAEYDRMKAFRKTWDKDYSKTLAYANETDNEKLRNSVYRNIIIDLENTGIMRRD